MEKKKPNYGYVGNSCIACGSCCTTIALTKNRTTRDIYQGKDVGTLNGGMFLATWWKPITRIEAFKRNPHLRKTYIRKKYYFFTCTAFSPDVGCTQYENRPSVCRTYPDTLNDLPIAKSPEESEHSFFSKRMLLSSREESEYSASCVYFPEIIPVVNV